MTGPRLVVVDDQAAAETLLGRVARSLQGHRARTEVTRIVQERRVAELAVVAAARHWRATAGTPGHPAAALRLRAEIGRYEVGL